jgi:Domain of unknown function (DUF1874).
MLYIGNAFSLSMVEGDAILKARTVTIGDVKKALENSSFVSAVGHEATAQIMSELIGVSIPYNRAPIKLKAGDTLVVFQLLKRLEEGRVLSSDEIKALPYKFVAVTVLQ